MFFVKSFVLFAFIFSVSALVTPYSVRSPHRHRGLSARVPVPEPVAVAEPQKFAKRAKCKPRPSSTTSSAVDKPTPEHGGANPTLSSTTTHSHQTPAASPPQTSTASAPKPTPHSGTGDMPSYMFGTQTGDGTFYGTGLGSCGITNNDNDHIVAVSHLLYDTYPGYQGGNPNNNPICGRKVVASYGGKSVTLTITDRCAACAITDLDMAPAAFNILADPSIGRLHGVTWVWDPPN
jgi:hypothetical protein